MKRLSQAKQVNFTLLYCGEKTRGERGGLTQVTLPVHKHTPCCMADAGLRGACQTLQLLGGRYQRCRTHERNCCMGFIKIIKPGTTCWLTKQQRRHNSETAPSCIPWQPPWLAQSALLVQSCSICPCTLHPCCSSQQHLSTTFTAPLST